MVAIASLITRCASLLSLALGAAAAVAVAAVPQGGEDCDLKSWVSAAAVSGEEGYHVLCALNVSALLVYANGVASTTPQLLALGGGGELREDLEQLLRIRRTLEYKVPGKPPLVWKKQPWTIFTAKGTELRPGTEEKVLASSFAKGRSKPVVLLLFEGGAWRWPTLRVGYTRRVMPGITLKTVSRLPALFEVHIDDVEGVEVADRPHAGMLQNVVEVSKDKLVPSETEGEHIEKMRSSYQTFLPYSMSPQLQALKRGTAKLLRSEEEHLEHLQVVRYTKGQHYDAHRDYWDPREFPDLQRFTNKEGFWGQRHATLLWYLKAPKLGGETWFPRAHGGGIPSDNWNACDERGVKMSASNASAALFYSLRADGDIDEYSWHCGCPVKAGEKWVANSWLHNAPMDNIRPKRRRPVTAAESLATQTEL